MSRRVTSLVASKTPSPHGGKGNAVHRTLPRKSSALSQATPDVQNKQALAESQAQQSDGVEQMAARMKKFNGPWNAVPQPGDDNAEGGY